MSEGQHRTREDKTTPKHIIKSTKSLKSHNHQEGMKIYDYFHILKVTTQLIH